MGTLATGIGTLLFIVVLVAILIGIEKGKSK
jgi:hypothetical protein